MPTTAPESVIESRGPDSVASLSFAFGGNSSVVVLARYEGN